MGRSRKFIRVRELPDGTYKLVDKGGFEITGVSLHKGTGTFYSIPSPGQPRETAKGGLQKIVRDYLARQRQGQPRPIRTLSTLQIADLDPDALPDETRQELGQVKSDKFTVDLAYAEQHIDQPFYRHIVNLHRQAKRLDPLPPLPSQVKDDPAKPSPQRLNDCFRLYREIKENEGVRAETIADVERPWKAFVKLIGNKPISELSDDDFAKWRRWVNKTRRKEAKSAKWHNDFHSKVKSVITEVKRDKPKWRFPAGLVEWASAWKSETYLPKKSNRQRMPVAVLNRLIEVADKWAATDPEQFDKKTQEGRARRKQAIDKREEGIKVAAIVRLMVVASLDNADIRRIQWEHIKQSAHGFTYMDFPRLKPARKVGAPIDRLTPLLPSTIAALERVRDLDGREGFIFRSNAKNGYKETTLNKLWARLLRAAKVTEWTAKHLRNVAPSLGKVHKVSTDERDAILGHAVRTDNGNKSSKFYEDDVDETYLVDLVNLVGMEYFDGEQVRFSGKEK